ncbi:HDA1 complex subunit 2 [Monosporozyma servazzii]
MTVFTIPIGLTEFQKDLIEILLSIHQEPLLKELALSSHDNDKLIDNNQLMNNESIHYPTFTSRQMMYLLDTHIRAVANHPCLLVDHYMPRQFLKMEPKQRLINPSNKFHILQQLLFQLTKYNQQQTPLSIVLVAHSMKELDLIEGLVLGQDFNLKRLSGTTLYDEKNTFPHDGMASPIASSASPSTTNIMLNEQSNNTSSNNNNNNKNNSSTPIVSNPVVSSSSNSDPEHVNSNMNKYTGYSKDDYHYTKNKKKRKLNKSMNHLNKNKNWLFLTTTKHLIHDEGLLHRYNTNLIIAFDPLIDDNMSCLSFPSTFESSKTTTTMTPGKIPIIKLLVKDSPDHYIIDHGLVNEQDVEQEYSNIKDSLLHFFINRTTTNDSDESKIDFNQLITQALKSVNDPTVGPTSLSMTQLKIDDMSKSQLLSYFEPHFMKKYEDTTSLTISHYPFNLKNYQSELMQRTLTRLHEITNKYESNDVILIEKRINETERQNQLDLLKSNIGIKFKSFQEKEKLQLESDKTLERITTENEKMKSIYNKLKSKCLEMDKIVEDLINKENVRLKIKEFDEKVITLESQLNKILAVNKERTAVEDKLRSQYQLDSTRAANKSLELKNWEKSKEFLQKRKQDPQWAELALQSVVSHQVDLEKQLKHYKDSNLFIKGYIGRMTELHLTNSRQASHHNSNYNYKNSNHNRNHNDDHYNYNNKNGGPTRGDTSNKTKKNHSGHTPNDSATMLSSSSSSSFSSSSTASSTSSISAEISTKNAITGSRLRSTRSTSPNYT